MTKKQTEAFELLVTMIQNLTTQVNTLSGKMSSDVSGIHKKIDEHVKGPCSVQNELTEHKKNNNIQTSQKTLGLANWIAFAGVAAAILIAVFK